MIMEVRDDGVTIVEAQGKKDIVLLSVAMYNVMKNIPEAEELVLYMMAGKITPSDLGVESRVNSLPKDADAEAFLRKMKGQEPASDQDIPDFVKRSLNETKDKE